MTNAQLQAVIDRMAASSNAGENALARDLWELVCRRNNDTGQAEPYLEHLGRCAARFIGQQENME